MQELSSFPQLLTGRQEMSLCKFVVSFLLACCGCYVYYLTFDFTLTKTYDFTVSIALEAGVDAPKRVSLYYQLLAIFCCVYIAAYKVVDKLLAILQQTLQEHQLRFVLQNGILLGSGLVALLSLQFIFPNPTPYFIGVLSVFIAIFAALYLAHYSRLSLVAHRLTGFCIALRSRINAVIQNLSPVTYVHLWMAFACAATLFLSISRKGEIKPNPFFYVALGIFCASITLTCLGKVAKNFPGFFSSRQLSRVTRFLSRAVQPDTNTALIFLLLLSLQFLFRAVFLFPANISFFSWNPFILSCLLYMVTIFLQASRPFTGRLFFALSPLLWGPFCYTFSAEVQYFLSKWAIINTYHIFLSLIFLLCLGSYFLLLLNKDFNKDALLKYLYLPIVFCTLYICAAWQPTSVLREDLLHTGNAVVLPQQILEYNQWPFIDFMPARGFQWSFGPLLYNLLNGLGESGIESVVTRSVSLELLVGCLLAYFVLCYFLPPLVSVIITEVFCFNMGFFSYGYYGITLVEIPIFLWYLKNKTNVRLCLTWLAPILIFAFHPASGKFAIISASLLFLVTYLKAPKKLFKVFLFGAGVFLSCGMCYFLVLHLCDKSIAETLLQILAFGKSQNLIGAYPHILKQVSASTFYIFLLIPIVSLLAVLFCSNKIINYGNPTPQTICLLYVALCLIFMTTISLNRHSPYEGAYIPSYFSLILFIFPLLLNIKKIYYIVWLALVLIIHPLCFPNIPFYKPNSMTFKTAQWHEARPTRVTIKATGTNYGANYAGITEFLKTHLGKNETFIDLTDAHLLYSKTHKPMAFFQHTIRMIRFLSPQKSFVRMMQGKYDRGEVPLALADSTSWGIANMDGSPSQTQFHIIQWLYKHYEPYKIVNGFQIWAAKNSRFAQEARPDFPIAQNHAWGKLAGLWATALLPETSRVEATSPGTYPVQLDTEPRALPLKDFDFIENGAYIVFNIRAHEATTLHGEVSANNASGKFSFQVDPSEAGKDYTIPLDALYAGFLRPENILLSADKPVELELSRK
ncbi:hypothetical protein [Desulfovibrio sp. ZJ746]|uniref:hypothetical protein n=1 Tax=Desulfovibrio sp. ZJ746 TaxID=2709795 RepID=UPI0013EAEECD|nr:hypothetical protein [Desulfovibrio sp. ZJ746]